MPVWLKEKILIKSVLQNDLLALDGLKKNQILRLFFLPSIMSRTRLRLFIPRRSNPPRCYAWMGLESGRPLPRG